MMDPKNKIYIPLIIIFFIFGVVIGYVAHKPATIEKPVYINTTIEKVVEKIVEVTPTLTATPAVPTPAPTATPEVPDFTVKIWDPSRDNPKYTVLLDNHAANPDTLSIRPGDMILIRITDNFLSNPLTLNLSSYTRNLGTAGAVVVTFNKTGTYRFQAIIPSRDPHVLPAEYARGTITVY